MPPPWEWKSNAAVTNDPHRVYLSLGSNIHPDLNLRWAIELLKTHGQVVAASTAWESRSVGAAGPNFLNACVEFSTPLLAPGIVEKVIRPIESVLGRTRTTDRNASRPIDIDIVLFDGRPVRLEYWEQAFMIVPLAELLPDYVHPVWHESLARLSERLRSETWIIPRREILPAFHSN